jgi:putative transcriptional regulator
MFGDILNMGSICCICEYKEPILLSKLVAGIDAELVCGRTDVPINGHTIIDSLRAILELLPEQFYKIYGRSTARVLVFTGVTTGRSPMVAIRVSNLKPGAVILQGISASVVDKIAIKIAEVENIPLLATKTNPEELSSILSKR